MAMKSINPREAYDQSKFVGAMEDLSDLGGIAQNISAPEGNWHPDLRKNLGILLRNNQAFYSGMSPDSVMDDLNEAHKQHEKEMQNYAIINFSTLLGKVSGKKLLQLVGSLPLSKTKRKNLDEVINTINEKREIERISKEGGMEEYVMGKLAKASDWRKQAYFGYSIGNGNYAERTFQAYAQSAEQDFARQLLDKKGNIKPEAEVVLREIIKENYSQFVAKDTDDTDKIARKYLSALAQVAYQEVKPAKKVKQGKIARTGRV